MVSAPAGIDYYRQLSGRTVGKRAEMIKVGVVGGTGYTGVELLRLLAGHPEVELRVITSRSEAGQAVETSHPTMFRPFGLIKGMVRPTEMTVFETAPGKEYVLYGNDERK